MLEIFTKEKYFGTMNTFYPVIYLLWYATDRELLSYSATFVKRKLKRPQRTNIVENVNRELTTHNVSFFLPDFSFKHFFIFLIYRK
jgi:hypothetical protein